ASREEIMSALFANMVMQQTNLAMMMLGRVAHPETGQFIQDVETARMFIDQLEMLEVKTKGNLSKEEEGLLKQGLTALRMAFVEAVGSSEAGQARPPAEGSAPTPPSAPAEPKAQPAPAPSSAAEDESRKKFSKKY
ncbi:MAG TPA: DUF1844 domain-containing protein, partial [Verrucomicrobiae bacterium]|nr:DUF1844 domain-containing protein [Verrucomicrobiae bacterium]